MLVRVGMLAAIVLSAACAVQTPSSDVKSAPPAAEVEAECRSAPDCRLHSDYCGGCSCLALASDAPEPECQRPVQCLIDPCQGRRAACESGRCVAIGSPGEPARPPAPAP